VSNTVFSSNTEIIIHGLAVDHCHFDTAPMRKSHLITRHCILTSSTYIEVGTREKLVRDNTLPFLREREHSLSA
jgi:hypothetical protein